jgi:hypothetical protein
MKKTVFFMHLHVIPNPALHVPCTTQCFSAKASLFIPILSLSLITPSREKLMIFSCANFSLETNEICFPFALLGVEQFLTTRFAFNFVANCSGVEKKRQLTEIPKYNLCIFFLFFILGSWFSVS